MSPTIDKGQPTDPRRLVHFRTDHVAPPVPGYVSNDDDLLVIIQNSAVNFAVQLNRRFLAPDGQLLSQSDLLTPASDRSSSVFRLPNAEGFFVGMTVTPSGTARRGQCYVKVMYSRNAGSIHSHLIASGYVDSTNELGWPGSTFVNATDGVGNVRSITGTTPGAGAEVSETVPTNARWRILSFRNSLTTNATVANRNSRLQIDDGVNPLFFIDAAAALVAGSQRAYVYGAGLPFRTSPTNTDDLYSLPGPLILRPGFRIRTLTAGLQAGDQYLAPQYLVEEWIEI